MCLKTGAVPAEAAEPLTPVGGADGDTLPLPLFLYISGVTPPQSTNGQWFQNVTELTEEFHAFYG